MRTAPAEATAARLSTRPAAPTQRASSRLPRLLDEAAQAFAQRGFAAASVREIVEPVGMLPGSLYCHFATKEALLAAVYKRRRRADRRCRRRGDRAARRPLAATRGRLRRPPDVAARPDRLLAGRDPRPAERRAGRRGELVALRDSYEKRFARLVAALPLARPTDRAMLRLMLVGALNWSQTWYRPGRGATPEQIARRFVGLLKASLAA